MKNPGPYKVEKSKAGHYVLNAPGTILTADSSQRVSVGIEAIAAQLNRAHDIGRKEGKAERDAEETKRSDTHAAQRDGWRFIAEALIAIGLDYPMRGFGNDPPTEILAGLVTSDIAEALEIENPEIAATDRTERQRAEDVAVLARIRDALFGRAWRIAGADGVGKCDYPLCPNRAGKIARKEPFALVAVQIAEDTSLRVCSSNTIEHDEPAGRKRSTMLHECKQWAVWVQQRASAGRIEIRR